jgi:myo-inositol-1-phosphate synthase
MKDSVLILIAGICGGVGSTVCATIGDARNNETSSLHKYLMTESEKKIRSLNIQFPPISNMDVAGWDVRDRNIPDALRRHCILPTGKWINYEDWLEKISILKPLLNSNKVKNCVDYLRQQIEEIKSSYPSHRLVFVDLLPATISYTWKNENLEQLLSKSTEEVSPDLIYAIAALQENIPVINFTSNDISHPALIELSKNREVPITGNDGKTGQTYFKVVLASSFAVRCVDIHGWYSLNILGNDDGRNLSNSKKASSKIRNKTLVLDDILGYKVGQEYDTSSNMARIDYYPPRGDNKEAWDVIDFRGIFDMPMSLRLNLQARDSILATPIIIDLVRWMELMHKQGFGGIANELSFYFKSPMGNSNLYNFQDQLYALYNLAKRLKGGGKSTFGFNAR